MTFQEAHDLMDLLLDKADQAYYTTAEKDKFLSMAIMEWFKELVEEAEDTSRHHELARFVVSQTSNFDDATDGYINANDDTISTTSPKPYNHDVGLVAPLYKMMHLRVQTYNGSWEETLPYSAGEYSNDMDPFNKPQTGYRRWRHRDSKIEVVPGTGLVNTVGQEAKFAAKYITYPNLSNVATGNFDATVLDYGTSDLPLGSRVPNQIATSGTIWNTVNGQNKMGASPEDCHDMVKRAVRMMTANIESPLYQVNAIEQKRSEQ